ncbi:type 1 fimbrial protein, partial [Salmonella enterica]|nr:type 1 fimbrial protein [Salmonella enterica]EHM8868873.1 type 1 fimbrial protein [Salmonella enterica]EHM9142223.1 type 1 fimbrial protein [Salmonella enterica]EHM9207139.1 type 1 fimbrial protein [Salmonella enterica]EHM9295740.1 type 1 fimbrial protein [Salmonella enterica]
MKNRLFLTAVLVTGLVVLPAWATKVADGTVSFTGYMSGPPTCTLENSHLTVDFGTIHADRDGGIPVSPRTVTFRLENCAAYVQKVKMAVSFQSAGADSPEFIGNGGSATGVAGQLACPAETQETDGSCAPGVGIRSGDMVTGTVQAGRVSFPLAVSLVPFDSASPSSPAMPGAGTVSMTVNFIFEEA